MKIGIVTFSPAGRELLKKVLETLPENQYLVFDPSLEPLAQWVGYVFKETRAIIFIGATGIAVRLIAPHIISKDKDPAVLVMDELGKHVIPLLSGHIGGANRLALKLASALRAEAVISTATDINGVFAVDEWSAISGCVIPQVDKVKKISIALLAREHIGFTSDFLVKDPLPKGLARDELGLPIGICITHHPSKKPFEETLHVVPQTAVLGVGCCQHTNVDEFEDFILTALAERDIYLEALSAIASIDLKRNEPCILHFAKKYELATHFYSAWELGRVHGDFSYSSFVLKVAGVDNVCERAAVLATGGGELVVPKNTHGGMSMALARTTWKCSFDPLLKFSVGDD